MVDMKLEMKVLSLSFTVLTLFLFPSLLPTPPPPSPLALPFPSPPFITIFVVITFSLVPNKKMWGTLFGCQSLILGDGGIFFCVFGVNQGFHAVRPNQMYFVLHYWRAREERERGATVGLASYLGHTNPLLYITPSTESTCTSCYQHHIYIYILCIYTHLLCLMNANVLAHSSMRSLIKGYLVVACFSSP